MTTKRKTLEIKESKSLISFINVGKENPLESFPVIHSREFVMSDDAQVFSVFWHDVPESEYPKNSGTCWFGYNHIHIDAKLCLDPKIVIHELLHLVSYNRSLLPLNVNLTLEDSIEMMTELIMIGGFNLVADMTVAILKEAKTVVHPKFGRLYKNTVIKVNGVTQTFIN